MGVNAQCNTTEATIKYKDRNTRKNWYNREEANDQQTIMFTNNGIIPRVSEAGHPP